MSESEPKAAARLDVTADDDGMIRIRESGNPDGVVVTTTPAKWRAFVLGVKAGEFDHFVEDVEDTEHDAP